MTVENNYQPVSYNGNGTTTVFAVSFPFISGADLQVILVAGDGDETIQAESTDYTVTGGQGAPGTVTMATAPVAGSRLVIYRQTGQEQPVDYITGGAFPAETHERALDRLTMLVQELSQELGKSLSQSPASAANYDPTLPEPVGNRAIMFNESGDGLTLSNMDINAITGSVEANAAAAAASLAAAQLAENAAKAARDSASGHRLNAQNAEAGAAAHEDAAAASAAAAQASESASSGHAATALAHQQAAANSETIAAGHASNAAISETNAANSANLITGQLNSLTAGDFFELDGNFDLMPTLTPVANPYYQLDPNGDIQPIA